MRRNSYVIRNSLVPVVFSWFFPVAAITIGPIIFIRKGHGLNLRLLIHEEIHVQQGRELFFVGFWFLYLFYWLRGMASHGNATRAYYEIPFEREAYSNDSELTYLVTRKPYAWRRYR